MTTLTNFEKTFSNNILGYAALAIILSTCLGAIAVFQILAFGNGLLQMFFVLLSVIICNLHNAAILSVQKPSRIFKLLVASVIINSLIIAGSLSL